MIDHIELLRMIENDAKLSTEDIAVRLGVTEEDVLKEIKYLEDEKIILGYTTNINWEKQLPEHCIGMIEVRIAPDKVSACYLMSGGFDLMVIYEDKSLRDIANFVNQKIATQEGVLSTTTHFILKKYKANGIVFDATGSDDRQAIIL